MREIEGKAERVSEKLRKTIEREREESLAAPPHKTINSTSHVRRRLGEEIRQQLGWHEADDGVDSKRLGVLFLPRETASRRPTRMSQEPHGSVPVSRPEDEAAAAPAATTDDEPVNQLGAEKAAAWRRLEEEDDTVHVCVYIYKHIYLVDKL